jgi:hypothetical protein
MTITKSTGPWTVWDTGFSFIVAPSDPKSHPHINAAVQIEGVRRWPTGRATPAQIEGMMRSAWNYANEMNAKAKAGQNTPKQARTTGG